MDRFHVGNLGWSIDHARIMKASTTSDEMVWRIYFKPIDFYCTELGESSQYQDT